MTTTIVDNDHGDQDDDEGEDLTRHPLQRHLRTENAESPVQFHRFTLFLLTLNTPQQRKLSISDDWIFVFFSDLFYLIDASNIFFWIVSFRVIDLGRFVGHIRS